MEVHLTLLNEEGMHARPAGILVKTANQFISKVEILFNGKTVNAKSVFGLMSLGLLCNSNFTLKIEGDDCEQACTAICQLVENRFKI
jgi:phosphocarrier protein